MLTMNESKQMISTVERRTIQKEYNMIRKHPSVIQLKPDRKKQQGNLQIIYQYLQNDEYKIGQGSFGKVYKCYYYNKEKDSTNRFALKIIHVPNQPEKIITIQQIVSTTRQQIKSLLQLQHNKNIVKIKDIIAKQQNIYLVLQYCNDKDIVSFFNKKRQKEQLNQIQIIKYFKQILNAFKEIYKQKLIHRDLKPLNILVHNGQLKVADFGMSLQYFQKNQKLNQGIIGTINTVAPQIIKKQLYTNKCDIYSLGVILFWMFYGEYPFKETPTKKQKVVFPDKLKKGMIKPSLQVIELIQEMLAYQEHNRINWQQLFSHKLFQQTLHMIEQSQDMKQIVLFNKLISQVDQEIPADIFKYIENNKFLNKIDLKKTMSKPNDGIIQAIEQILKQFHCEKFKISFFKYLMEDLNDFQVQQYNYRKIEQTIIKDIVRFGIQKWIQFTYNNIILQLMHKQPNKIFDIDCMEKLAQSEDFSNIVQGISNEVQSYEESQRKPKLSVSQRTHLIKQCDQFAVTKYFPTIVSEFQIQYSNKSTFIKELNDAIIELIYMLKPQILKYQRQNNLQQCIEDARFRTLILLIHHLYMMIKQEQIFPKSYDPNFKYDSENFARAEGIGKFSRNQSFQAKQKLATIIPLIINILQHFED